MPKLTPVHGVECMVSSVAFVTGEHEGCYSRGVSPNPPILPNISQSGKSLFYNRCKF